MNSLENLSAIAAQQESLFLSVPESFQSSWRYHHLPSCLIRKMQWYAISGVAQYTRPRAQKELLCEMVPAEETSLEAGTGSLTPTSLWHLPAHLAWDHSAAFCCKKHSSFNACTFSKVNIVNSKCLYMHWGPFNSQLWLPEPASEPCLPQDSVAVKGLRVTPGSAYLKQENMKGIATSYPKTVVVYVRLEEEVE